MIGYASETPIKTYNNVASMGATKIIMINTYIINKGVTMHRCIDASRYLGRRYVYFFFFFLKSHMAFSSVLPFLLPTHSVDCAVHLLLCRSGALLVNSALFLPFTALIMPFIFSSPR